MVWILILQLVFQCYLAFLVGYLLLLTIAAWISAREKGLPQAAFHFRFLILIPAHNEERLLPDLLASLNKQDYPRELFQIHVVADNCTDQTAKVAEPHAHVHIRKDDQHLGKGHALNWLLEQIWQTGEPHDAILFLDADSIVSPNFLQVMSSRLERGERAIQAYYAVRNPGQSWTGSLRYAALAVLHFLRPQGRMTLGTSAGLKGNGMVFSADLMKAYSWSASLVEDIEMHMALLLDDQRVTFAPKAVVWGEMPDKLSASASQHMRWEHGKKEMARRYVPKLLLKSWKALWAGRPRSAFLLCDAVMEFLQPPFSILMMMSLLNLLTSLVFWIFERSTSTSLFSIDPSRLVALNVLLAALLLLGQGVYLFAGLRAVSAPRQVYLNLLNAPRLMIWKSWQMLLVSMSQGNSPWIRTKRNEE